MNKRRWHDFDDGFDETSLFEDEEFPLQGRRKLRRSPRERDEVVRAATTRRRREPGGSKISRAPH